mmetsp:Transcript_22464/g.64571  ORF Transcript_22464/g.64571 Transcript_22464/m.64571 type:complete len:207 (+) Transcript_22464:1129-1749(+)
MRCCIRTFCDGGVSNTVVVVRLLLPCEDDGSVVKKGKGAAAVGALVDSWLDISLGIWLAPPDRGGRGGGGGIMRELVLRNIPTVGLGMTVAGRLISACSKVLLISSNDLDCLIGLVDVEESKEKDTDFICSADRCCACCCCCCWIRALHRSVLLTSALTFLQLASANVLACRAMREHTRQTCGLVLVLACCGCSAACRALTSRQRL